MSYILDALQKSERKRQRDSVPDLQTVHNPEPPKKKKGPLWAWLLTAMFMSIVVLLVVYLPKRQSDNYLAQPVPGELEKPAASQLRGEKKMMNENNRNREVLPTSITDAADHIAESIPTTKQPGNNKEKATSGGDAPVEHLSQIHSSPDLPVTLNQQGATYEEKMEPALEDTSPSIQAPEPVADVIETDEEYWASEIANPKPNLKTEDVVPLLTSLPLSLRKSIPELTISFHVFTQNPETRLVSINGRIYRQGQDVSPNLTLEEITTAGVVLNYKGERFRLKVF